MEFLYYSYLWAFAVGNKRGSDGKREMGEGGGTFGIDKQLNMVRYINMRSESIAVGDGEGESKGEKVCE